MRRWRILCWDRGCHVKHVCELRGRNVCGSDRLVVLLVVRFRELLYRRCRFVHGMRSRYLPNRKWVQQLCGLWRRDILKRDRIAIVDELLILRRRHIQL